MPRQVKLEASSDFRPGLNLRADAFQLLPGESPDLLNVDVDPRGGFRLRHGVTPINSTLLTADATEIWTYANGASVDQILVRDATRVSSSTGGNFTTQKTYGSAPATIRAATMNNKNYWVAGDVAVVKWDGTTASDLAATFNDDFTAPDDGDMPRAKLIAVWNNHCWVANTIESSTAHPNRIRFSHPNRAEDWRTDDWIDISVGQDGDEITALVPAGDRLLIFKRQSVHAIFGYDFSSFNVVPLVQTTGATRQEAVTVSDDGVVYWFNWPSGVFSYDGKSVKWEFERLIPLIQDGTIPAEYQAKIACGWLDHRLWVSVPEDAATVNSASYVFDPSLGKQGGWVKYDLALHAMREWKRDDSDAVQLGCGVGNKLVLNLITALYQDNFGSNVDIVCRYRTHWFDGGSSVFKKRWRRPEFVLEGDADTVTDVEVFYDYDPSSVRKYFQLETTRPMGTGEWDVHDWDEFSWAQSPQKSKEIDRGGILGRARSVQLKFAPNLSVNPSREWGVSSIGLKYVPKRLR